EVILPCQLKISSISGSGDLKLSWILDKSTEKIIVKTYTQNKNTSDSRYQGRAELFYDELNKGNMSLILKKSQLIDQGKYTVFHCQCLTSRGSLSIALFLLWKLNTCCSFAAKGVDPTITLRDYKGQGIGLTCASEGWYPKPQALWLSSKGENRTEKEITTSTENAAGTFSIFSAITIEPGTASEVSCKIFSSVLQQESESRIMIAEVFYPTTSPWIAPFTIILLIFIYKRACSVIMDSCVVFFLFFPLAAVTLDSEYKHPEIIISEDKRKASLKAPTPGQPGAAVETLIVVGKEGYAAGKHYWEVRVGEGLDWELGVLTQAERDKAKKASLVGPLGEGCWALRSVRGDLFSSQSENKLEKKGVSYQVIGLFLDREAGDISFHNAAITFPINSIPIQSTEKLYPFLSLGKERLLPSVPSGPLISKAEALLWEPSLKEIGRESTQRRAFSLCLALTFYCFRCQEKPFLFYCYFNV
uniref:Ig-like domain-containing protein n=1 Tax=Varanus komodoensis TaxID=61221 RepID=A0A8D2IT48_VARKO